MEYVIIGIAAFLVSIVSAIGGGGGGLVTTPLMLLLGFDPIAALASVKAAGLGINIGAINVFIKKKHVINWHHATRLALLAIVASIIGTNLILAVDEEVLQKLIGGLTITIAVLLVVFDEAGIKPKKPSHLRLRIGYILYFIIMALQAGVGSGIGVFLMFVLLGFFGLDALQANATKRVAGLVLVVTSFTIFAFSGYMDWLLSVVLFTSMLVGGNIGARIALNKGKKLVKQVLLIISLFMGLSVLVFN